MSDFLNPEKSKGMTANSWHQLVAGLQSIAASKADLCAIDPSIESDIQEILGWSKEPVQSKVVRLHPPGGPMPYDAANYVVNTTTDKAREIINFDGSQSVLVRGGLYLGRSTWLQRLCQDALNRGACVVVNDAQSLKIPDENDPISRFLSNVASETELPEIAEITIENEDFVLAAERFIDAIVEYAGGAELYIIVEDVESWLVTVNKYRNFSRLVTKIQQELINRQTEFAFKFVFASALTPSSWSAIIGSPLENHSTVASLSYFSEEAVSSLTSVYRLDPSVSEEVYFLTSGHPKFTQKMLWSIWEGEDLNRLKDQALHFGSAGGWDSIETRLWQLLQAQATEFKVRVPGMLSKFEAGIKPRLNRQEFILLKSLGLVDGSQRFPVVSEIALSMFEHWRYEEL